MPPLALVEVRQHSPVYLGFDQERNALACLLSTGVNFKYQCELNWYRELFAANMYREQLDRRAVEIETEAFLFTCSTRRLGLARAE